MGKYSKAVQKDDSAKRDTVNPYMRGIGCLMMVIVPIFSYMAGAILSDMRIGLGYLPSSWYVAMQFPDYFYNISGLTYIANFLGRIERLPATLLFAVIIMLVVGGIVSIVFGYMYNIMAPSRYGPFDVPPPRIKTKKYRR